MTDTERARAVLARMFPHGSPMAQADLATKLAAEFGDIREECAKAIPTTWLDPLLTGPDKIAAPPYTGPQIEALLQAIRDRICGTED